MIRHESEKMACPLLSQSEYVGYIHGDGSGMTVHEAECRYERCAWWDVGHQRCAIAGISIGLGHLEDKLNEIRDRV